LKRDFKKNDFGVVGVLNFDNLTDYVNAGSIVSKILRTELYINGFNIVPEYELKKIIKTQKINFKNFVENKKYAKLGRMLNLNNIIIGSVSEYRYKHGLGDDPAVGINLRMINCVTGEVLWANSYSKSGGKFLIQDSSLNEITQELCKKMVKDILKNISKK